MCAETEISKFRTGMEDIIIIMHPEGKIHRVIMEKALRIIKQQQIEIDNARIGSFGFIIRKDETLQEGMARNYNEFDEERSRLQKLLETSQKLLSDLEFRKDYANENRRLQEENNQLISQSTPCSRTCYHHQTHPCENCGRINGYLPSVWHNLCQNDKNT